MSGLTPESSAIRMTPELEQRIANCTNAEEIKNVMFHASREQGLVEQDKLNPTVLHATPLANNAPRRFAKYVVVDGEEHLVEGSSPEELQANELQLMRELFSGKPDDSQARGSDGKFVSDKQAQEVERLRLAELEGQYKRGEITLDDYIVNSGAVERAVQQREQSDTIERQSWEEATAQFIENHPNWQGGDKNRETLSQIIIENRWVNRDPLEALEAAYRIAAERGRLVDNPEVAAQQKARELQEKIAQCTDPNELRSLLGYSGVARDSGIWGR